VTTLLAWTMHSSHNFAVRSIRTERPLSHGTSSNSFAITVPHVSQSSRVCQSSYPMKSNCPKACAK
jgi:hypothetical protein